uniref:Uncharacterized protein n=1 Tax=Arion vulgaris TaxID=1028688 RepID=A0A0B7B757_9EUPU
MKFNIDVTQQANKKIGQMSPILKCKHITMNIKEHCSTQSFSLHYVISFKPGR